MITRPGRRTIGLGILVLWLAGLAILLRRELFRPHLEQLAEAGLRVTPGASFYAVLQNGAQIGFASTTIDTADGGITVTDYLVADLPIAGKVHRASARTLVHLTRSLHVSSFDINDDAGPAPINESGRVVGDSLLLLAVHGAAGQTPDTRSVHLSGPILLPTLLPLAVALGGRPTPGAHYAMPIFDPVSMTAREVKVSVQAERVFVLQDSSVFDSTSARWRGTMPDTVRAWKLSSEFTGASGFTGWVDEQGRVVLAMPLLGLTVERRPYEVAFENWKADALRRGPRMSADRDILETTPISAGKQRLANLLELRVRLHGVELDGFDVKGYRQRLKGDTLTVAREGAAALTARYLLPNGARSTVMSVFLDAEPLLETRSPEIIALAARLRGSDTDPRVVADRINRWLYDSLKKENTVGVPSALQTLRTRVGDGNEHAQLYVALSRAAGIPARVAAGLAYVDRKFYYHAWPEVFLQQWVAVDPTFGQFPADASHVRLTIGGHRRQAELLRLMDALQIDVLSAH